MKKSCIVKKSKVIKCVKGDVISNESRDLVTQESHTNCDPFEADINLRETGKESEQSDTLEKGNNYKNSGVLSNEKFQRTSPRLAKLSLNAAKWIDNSFDIKRRDETTLKTKINKEKNDNSKLLKTKFNESAPKKDNILNNFDQASTNKKSKKSHSAFDFGLRNTNEVSIPKNPSYSKKKAQYSTIIVEETVNNKKNESPREVSPSFMVGKKRTSLTEKSAADFPKKLKMEESVNNNNNLPRYDDISKTSDCNFLKIELELEKRQKCAPFVMRDIKTIVAECESRNQKWKETFLKYDCPARWGIPIVRNSTEKWDSKDIPLRLLKRYQKHLLSKNMCHPVFLPSDSQTSFNNELSSLKEDFKIHSKGNQENDDKEVDFVQESFSQDDATDLQNSLTENSERMVLRNRNQYKATIIEDEENLSNDSDEWSNKQKGGKSKAGVKSPKSSFKKKKTTILNNQQLILNMEKCNINQKNGIKGDEILGNNSSHEYETNLKSTTLAETMICPICSLRFPKQLIEGHATECASKTYKD